VESRNVSRSARGLAPLRIAQIAPLFESVPPRLYGGTERVVAYLCQELKRRGHQVTLFASGDSTIDVPIKPGCPNSLRTSGLDRFGAAYHLSMLSELCESAQDFDIIHSHIDYWSFPFQRMLRIPTVSTMHNRMDQAELDSVYRHYKDLPLVSISNAQRSRLPDLKWVRTIYHGTPEEQWKFNPTRGKYLAFLGRFSPEKRPDLAIEVARRAGIPLKMAAKVDRVDQQYFETVVKPLLSTPGVEYVGEISEREKVQFLGQALALLFPIDWAEPFGLVMIEALACGTPVIARPCGSVPEVLKDGITGFIASELDGLVEAVCKVGDLSRRIVREEFETRFSAAIMAAHYEELYYNLIEDVEKPIDPSSTGAACSEPVSSDEGLIADTESAVDDDFAPVVPVAVNSDPIS
jgi:glycosyltransferase involved in cell wall biosynthesis